MTARNTLRRRPALTGTLLAAAVIAALLAGCAQPAPTHTPTLIPRPRPSVTPTPVAVPAPAVRPSGDPVTVVDGLTTPWSVVRLDSGSALISERDTARILELPPGGGLREVTTVAGVVPGGEGGLLGLEVGEFDGITWLYAYYTSADDNRIVRFELLGGPGAYAVGAEEVLVAGIAKAGNHNGGRLAFGPDGMLYATTGDAGDTALSQDPTSLNGKILRMHPDGSAPSDNPFAPALTWSYGHRNPQGLDWDQAGHLWAAEFGQDTWDELNLIEPGGNYGWPVVEGVGDDSAYLNPSYVWTTDTASPSGLTRVSGTFFLAALRGQRLWVLEPGVTDPVEYYSGDYGRLRAVLPGPGGSLWLVTSNTDGRGSPRDGDDRILQVELAVQ